MFRFINFCNCIIFLLMSVGSAAAWDGTVTRVLDGDSLRVRQGDQLVTIRLYGIDSPEYGQSCWREAKDGASELVLGKMVSVTPVETDQFGRTVALIGVRGQLVNAEMVRRGLAWVYPRYCKAQPLCRSLVELEQVAKTAKLGLWRERRPVPPWVWKHGKP